MRLIDIKTLRRFWLKHRDAQIPLTRWILIAKEAEWFSIRDVRRVYPHADAVIVGSSKVATVFNIAGNKYRLVTAIHYNMQVVYLMMIMTHAEYSAGHWRKML
jgi:mRNA interferase HigB